MSADTEERIQALCRRALGAKDDAEVECIVADLRIAIHEHISLARIALGLRAALIPGPSEDPI